MLSGFIPHSRGTFMMDLVVVAMVAVLPLLTGSVFLVRRKKKFARHKQLQVVMGVALILTVALFEIEVRVMGWRQNAVASPYYDTMLFPFLGVHLVFAISTFLLWIVTLSLALRRMPKPPQPSAHSHLHRRLGYCTVIGTFMTSITGWTFYWLAFVAS